MEAPTAQVQIKKGCIIAEGTGPSIIWVTPTRAKQLIDAGAVTAFGKIPTEQPEAGPKETKPAEPAEKKSSATEAGGLSTDSAKSTNAVTSKQSSASAVAQVSRPRRSAQSKGRGTRH